MRNNFYGSPLFRYEKGLEFGVNFRVLSGERVDVRQRKPFVPPATQPEVLLSKV